MLNIFKRSKQRPIGTSPPKTGLGRRLELLHSSMQVLADKQIVIAKLIVAYIVSRSHHLRNLVLLQLPVCAAITAGVVGLLLGALAGGGLPVWYILLHVQTNITYNIYEQRNQHARRGQYQGSDLPKQYYSTCSIRLISFYTEFRLKKIFCICWLEGLLSGSPQVFLSSAFTSLRILSQFFNWTAMGCSRLYLRFPSSPSSCLISFKISSISFCLLSISLSLLSFLSLLFFIAGSSCLNFWRISQFQPRSMLKDLMVSHWALSSIYPSFNAFSHSSRYLLVVLLDFSYSSMIFCLGSWGCGGCWALGWGILVSSMPDLSVGNIPQIFGLGLGLFVPVGVGVAVGVGVDPRLGKRLSGFFSVGFVGMGIYGFLSAFPPENEGLGLVKSGVAGLASPAVVDSVGVGVVKLFKNPVAGAVVVVVVVAGGVGVKPPPPLNIGLGAPVFSVDWLGVRPPNNGLVSAVGFVGWVG